MKKTLGDSVRLATVCLLVQAALMSTATASDRNREPRRVNYSDIPERVHIIGRLRAYPRTLVCLHETKANTKWSKAS